MVSCFCFFYRHVAPFHGHLFFVLRAQVRDSDGHLRLLTCAGSPHIRAFPYFSTCADSPRRRERPFFRAAFCTSDGHLHLPVFISSEFATFDRVLRLDADILRRVLRWNPYFLPLFLL